MKEELIKALQEIGYSEEQVQSIVEKKKVYFQNQVDDITNKVRETALKNYSENYVSKEDFTNLETNYRNLQLEVKTNKIKEVFVKNGGIDNYFNDFIKLNGDLLEKEDNKQLEKTLIERNKTNPWAFKQEQVNLSDYGIKEDYKAQNDNLMSDYYNYEKFNK